MTDYRVYLLLVPQTHLVAATDTGTYAAGQLSAAEPKVQTAIDALTDPQEKASAQAKLDDMTAKVDAATTAMSGVADAMLALKPADIPAQLATIDGYRAKVASARQDLRQAIADAKALKALLGHPVTAPARPRAPPPLPPPADRHAAASLLLPRTLHRRAHARRPYGMTVTASRTDASDASEANRAHASSHRGRRSYGCPEPTTSRTPARSRQPQWQWSTRITAGTSDGSSRSVRSRPARQVSTSG